MDFFTRFYTNPQSSDKSTPIIKKPVKVIASPVKKPACKSRTYKNSTCKGKTYKKCKKRCKWVKKTPSKKGFCRIRFNSVLTKKK